MNTYLMYQVSDLYQEIHNPTEEQILAALESLDPIQNRECRIQTETYILKVNIDITGKHFLVRFTQLTDNSLSGQWYCLIDKGISDYDNHKETEGEVHYIAPNGEGFFASLDETCPRQRAIDVFVNVTRRGVMTESEDWGRYYY